MPNITIEDLEKNRVKITVTVPVDDVQPHLEAAAKELASQTKIPGFRPGKAGFDVVKQRVGEMKLYEHALESIVRSTYVKALIDHDIESVGSPKIDVEKLAPGNPIVYTAEVARMPQVTELANLSKITVKQNPISVDDKEVDTVLKDLVRMQTKEVRVQKDTVATATDKAVVNMAMKKEGVPLEGGSSPNHHVHLGEDHYIPGFKDEVIGMKEGEQKSFTLTFPKEHGIKNLAGQKIDFDITLAELYHLECPPIDDGFAKELGQESLQALKEKLCENITHEKTQHEHDRQERELLETVAKKSQFDEIPDLLLNEEVNKMIDELKRRVEEQGGKFDDYLTHIKKSLTEIKLDLTPEALTRIKVALVLRKVAKDQEISASDTELDARLDEIAEPYQDDKAAKEQIYSPEYRQYIAHTLTNRKVIDWLKAQVLEKKS